MPYSKAKWTPEEIRAFRREVCRRYDIAHPEITKAKYRRYFDRHPERVYATQQASRARAGRVATTYKWAVRNRLKTRQEYVDAYGGCCACCGEVELLFLTLDHVNGDGADHRRQYEARVGLGTNKRTSGFAQKMIIKELKDAGWPQDGRFRILCWNCQWGTRYPGGCPHQWEDGFPEDQ